MNITITFTLLVTLTVGVVEAIKRLGLSHKYLPLTAIAVGIFLCAVSGLSVQEIIIGGVMIGLSSVGLYSGVKNTIE